MHSFHHALDHFRLDGAVSKGLAVEVLGLVANSVTGVASNRNSDFFLFSVAFSRSTLVAGLSHIESGSQWVYIKERIFPVMNCSHWGSV